MSLPPDEMPETNLSLYEALEAATSNMHHWEKARQQYVEAARKAERGVAHANEAIAENTEKMNEALAKLGFINAPDAEVAA